MDSHRKDLSKSKRIVLKLGSSVLTGAKKELDDAVFKRIAAEICDLEKKGRQFILVSSGAIAAGRALLAMDHKSLTIPQKQAAAAVGQTHLIRKYEVHFNHHQRIIGQMLLTHDDLSDRTRYLNARHTLETLLENKVVPIINENDSVIVEEIKFGDNDTLSALITPLIEADLLILLTDTDGLFDRDPRNHRDAQLIPIVRAIDERIEQMAKPESGKLGVGGMSTKVAAAKRAASYGVPTVIANGHHASTLTRILVGEDLGTVFLPAEDRLTSRKHWIAHTLKPKGMIEVDFGALKALGEDGKSLLPSGIVSIEGKFDTGDAVEIFVSGKKPFAKGITAYNVKELALIKGRNSAEIEKVLGYKYTDEVIHRDDLVILKE